MWRKLLGRTIGASVLLGAAASALMVVRSTSVQPRTDDAEVSANLIGIAPEVNGRIARIHVKDNQFVRKGDLLFEIGPLPYEFALEKARSEQAVLEGQIKDLERTISAQASAVHSARARVASAQARIASTQAATMRSLAVAS